MTMEPQLTPLGKIVKWLLVPIAFAWVGYQFVAPKVGRPNVRTPISIATDGSEPISGTRTTSPIPPIQNELPKKSVRRPKKSTKQPEEEATPPASPEPEPA